MSKIGLLGGSFDPPHFGHLKLASIASEHLGLDEIWFIPVYVSPFKIKAPPVSALHRLEMCKLLVENHPNFKVLDFEILKKRPSYTVDSLEFLKNKYPEHQFYLLLGQDALDHFLFWKNPEEIVKMVKLAVAPRSKDIDISFLKANPLVYRAAQEGLLPMPLIPISSTEIRKSKGNLEGVMPKKIAEYIDHHQLYKIP